MAQSKPVWQSKLVLLVVLPAVGANVVLWAHWWAVNLPSFAIATIGLSIVLGLVAWKVRSATPWAAVCGGAITANLMFATASFPYQPWRTALIPVLALLGLTSVATRAGRARKERLGLAEERTGRSPAQVAANLGVAALLSSEVAQAWLIESRWFTTYGLSPVPIFAPMLAALAEAAADTVSSEIGQVFGGRPILITTFRRVDAGTDGGVSIAGTLAGIAAAAIVAAFGYISISPGGLAMASIAFCGGVFGLLFDSLLGATIEQRGWLNNDLVNFLSTASAAGFAMLLMALVPHHGVG